MDKETAAEITAGGRTSGAFRCLNCFVRISPPKGSRTYKCPNCGFEWRISWPMPNQPRIRGPVWEVNKRLADEVVTKKGKRRE